MASLQNSPSIHRTLFLNAPSQLGLQKPGVVTCSRRGVSFLVRAEQTMSPPQDRPGRRQALVVGTIGALVSLINPTSSSSLKARLLIVQCVGSLNKMMDDVLREHPSCGSVAAEAKKGFLGVLDKKDGYEFLYPFGWQEVSIEGLDKVVKDVIEPLESASVTMIPTSKQDVRDLGSPQQVAEVLIKKVWASPSEKTKLVEAIEHEVDGKAYYTIEFIGQAPNYTRHALAAICIGNGKFYTFTTGANQRRWEKMKDKLHTVVDSFKIFNV